MSEERTPYNAGPQNLHKQIETIASSLATDIVKQLFSPGEQVAELAQRRVFSVCEDVIARHLLATTGGEPTRDNPEKIELWHCPICGSLQEGRKIHCDNCGQWFDPATGEPTRN